MDKCQRFHITGKVDTISELTSSSATIEKPRDASCLSVIRFNSTIPQAHSFIISYFGFRFTTVHDWILICCLQRKKVFTRGDRRRNCRLNRLRQPVAPTIASCIHYEQPVAATMQITASHVVLRNDVSVDVIANDQFCWVGYKMAMWSEEETLQLINIMKPQCCGKAIVNSTGKK